MNLDLMFAIPGQTMEAGAHTGEALALGSEHLSCYEVIYEEDTPSTNCRRVTRRGR
jgi:coproporphyrinogen III oxidase-like Fe-S oxidoreductase